MKSDIFLSNNFRPGPALRNELVHATPGETLFPLRDHLGCDILNLTCRPGLFRVWRADRPRDYRKRRLTQCDLLARLGDRPLIRRDHHLGAVEDTIAPDWNASLPPEC